MQNELKKLSSVDNLILNRTIYNNDHEPAASIRNNKTSRSSAKSLTIGTVVNDSVIATFTKRAIELANGAPRDKK